MLAGLDQMAGILSATVRSYQQSAVLFDAQQMNCSGLEGALAAVAARWNAYGARRTQAGSLDPTRARRDSSLAASVDTVQGHFERSGCARR